MPQKPDKEAQKEETALLKVKQGLEQGKPIRALEISEDDRKEFIRFLQFITDKPVRLGNWIFTKTILRVI